ncbi:IQ domain-containing protein F5 [Oryctolagus cuniculus]|uniref:IQ domain-containing protein F5 n=1 Tax=Oryctolagus cuniculus TaxID=9986 RepID=UPI0022325AC0|nr:IQ domain-containing protein F5 [Oryctolagus cuniculus]
MGSPCCKPQPEEKVTPEKKPKPEKIEKAPAPPPPPKPKPLPPNAAALSTKIQAWWRGTLLRRTLLHAALRAWVIQCWWRKLRQRHVERNRQALLDFYLWQTRAAVRLQTWYRMWCIRRRYCTVLNAVHIIQGCWRYHKSQTRYFFRGVYEITASQLKLQLDMAFGPQICRITDSIPFPIKD